MLFKKSNFKGLGLGDYINKIFWAETLWFWTIYVIIGLVLGWFIFSFEFPGFSGQIARLSSIMVSPAFLFILFLRRYAIKTIGQLIDFLEERDEKQAAEKLRQGLAKGIYSYRLVRNACEDINL